MARYMIPDKSGPYKIIESMAGLPLVLNDSTGRRKVRIPCRDWAHAEEVLQKLNEGDHNGVITV